MTRTEVFVKYDAWASTLPWACDTSCVSLTHDHTPMVGAPCALCGEALVEGEECYYVTQLPRGENGREQAVCWRHVRLGKGPITVSRR